MSSGGWEVVTKNKKDKNIIKNGKLSKTEKKKFIDNAPRVEDFLPLNQVKTLYDNLDGNKENKTPKDKENKTKENEERKKQQKQNQQQSEKKKQQQQQKPKEKSKVVDKTAITVDQVNELLETNKVRFPDAPLIWLKDLVAYVNANIIPEKSDAVFSNKPDTYPLSLITKAVRTTFEKVIKSAGMQNVQLFYEGTLLLMTKNMANGLSEIGCKIFLQLLAQMYPEITCANVEKHISLRNSYQNKKPIGLSLLWVLSQGGKKNLDVGLKLWHEVMAPMLESRNYAQYVMKILNEILDAHKNVNSLSTDMYRNIIDDLCSGKINIPTSLGKEINHSLETLRFIAIHSDKINVQSLFETIFDNISPKTITLYKEESLKILSACIVHDARCLVSWKNLHSKRLYQSDLLIKQLADDLDTIRTKVNTKVLKETLSIFKTTETKTRKNKEDLLMAACEKKSEDLIKKMAAAPKKSRGFPYKKGSIILLLLIGALVMFDWKKHGSFEASSTGRLLKTSGTITYGQKVWLTTQHYSNKGLAYLEASSPEYYKYATNLGRQYGKLAGDFYLVGRNLVFKWYNNVAVYIEEKRPIIIETIESNFPGWIDTIQSAAAKQLEITRKYSAQAADYIVTQSKIFNRWLETSVFVGNMSPENIRGYATKAIESTQTFASQTYDWVYEKVQTLSKVE
ncbi:hypothetical protein PV325_012842 [Microctonus aethiopoides]|nr:hypothetical protein PV325_012842 [Microctonus aethiopoides]